MYDVIVVGARVAGAPLAMLLARAGHKVLVVDRDTFPSDTLSTHYIHQPGLAALQRWGLLDTLLETGAPPIPNARIHLGPMTLQGFGPAVNGINFALSPRRTVLDKILVDAAREAGADVREGFSVLEILREGDTVTGIRGRDAGGTVVTEHAKVVVGADGQHSLVARAVNAPKYNEKPALACYYYSYFRGIDSTDLMLFPGEGQFAVGFPTNDGLFCIGAGLNVSRFHEYRSDIEGTFHHILETLGPDFATKARAAERVERWNGTADLDNFFRKPYGPGWALVGDAGYHKDPVTGYGITDALRDAETLADALSAGLSGRAPLMEALAGYEEARNAFAFPLYEFICEMASFAAPTPEQMALFGAMAHDQEALSQFIGVMDGSVSVPEFFDPANLGRIISGAQSAAA